MPIFPINNPKWTSYRVDGVVLQAVESSIVCERQCSFLGKFTSFAASDRPLTTGSTGSPAAPGLLQTGRRDETDRLERSNDPSRPTAVFDDCRLSGALLRLPSANKVER
jgi:hypothetical protein